MIALIPFRAGSKRVPNKNFRDLGGRPLWMWTRDAALESDLFMWVVLCTDAPQLVAPGAASVWHRRDVPDSQPDIEWVREVIEGYDSDEYCILRPTSPFRGPETIRRAFEQWEGAKDRLESLRAVTEASETGFKQWRATKRGMMQPLIWPRNRQLTKGMTPFHSRPTQSLPKCYIQTGALEMFHRKTVTETGTISGTRVGMFITEGPEAINIDTEMDWELAETYVKGGSIRLFREDHVGDGRGPVGVLGRDGEPELL